jgi:thiopurine S-methyltransferase
MILNNTYWNNRYINHDSPWNIGASSPALIEYCRQLHDNTLKILIPGAGYAHEAAQLYQMGFKNVFVLDFAEQAISKFKENNPLFPQNQIIIENFFEHIGQYDLILEQTFFCALIPNLRNAYAKKIHELLCPNGKLVGLLFDAPLNNDKPPFGGSKPEYTAILNEHFKIKTMEMCHNSIEPRKNRELFFICIKS